MSSPSAIDEIISAAASRQMAAPFNRAAGDHDGVVIAGASGLIAEHTLNGLRRQGTCPLALVDNNRALWGVHRHGVAIEPPGDAILNYPDAVYVAAVFTHTPLRRQLSELGARHVTHYASLFHKYPEVFLPFFAVGDPSMIAAEAESVRTASRIWADDESAELFKQILHWFVTLESHGDSSPPDRTYFPELLKLRSDEVYVDCGAFDGDTIQAYTAASNGVFRKIVAIEPDPETFSALCERVGTLERTSAVNAAVGSERGLLSFVASGASSSHAQSAGAQGLSAEGRFIQVDMIRLDDLDPRPTYVKMDIEGFERQALAGARTLLLAGETAFAVTLYHRMNDLWQIPLYIAQAAPRLKLFLRRYAEDWAETVCYAVPSDRVVAPLS